MKLLLLLCSILFLNLPLRSQHWTWDSAIHNPSKLKLHRSADGAVYCYGFREETITRYNGEMQIEWQRTLPGLKIFRMVSDPQRIYIAGEFSGTLLVDGFNMKSMGKNDIFLASLDPADGKVLMMRGGGSPEQDYVGDISVGNEIVLSGTVKQSFWFAGQLFQKDNNMSFFLASFSQSGKLLGMKQAVLQERDKASAACWAIDHEQDKKGNVLLLAGVNGRFTIDGSEVKDEDATWLLKFDPGLNLLLSRKLENEIYGEIDQLLSDQSDALYCIRHLLYHQTASAAVLKLAEDGSLLSEYSPSFSCNLHEIEIAEGGDILYTGIRIQRSYIGTQGDTYYLVSGGLHRDLSPVWQKLDSSAHYVSGSSLCMLNETSLLVSGTFSEHLKLSSEMTAGPYGQFLALLQFTTTGVAVQHAENENQCLIYPNPSSGKFTLSGIRKNSMVCIYNATGVCIYSGPGSQVPDLSAQQKGIYLVEMRTEKKVYRNKLVLE